MKGEEDFENFYNVLKSNSLHHTILLPIYFLKSEKLLFNIFSSILNEKITNLNQVEVFFVKPNEVGNILIENIKEAISFGLKTAIFSKYKFIVIEGICKASTTVANAILKILEEPPKDTFFLLFYNNESQILPTIRSRSLKFNFCNSSNNFTALARTFNVDELFISYIFNLTGGNLNIIHYFKDESEVLINDFERLIQNFSYIELKKLLSKYSKFEYFKEIILLILENKFANLQKKLTFVNQNEKKYFSFILCKKYIKLYNINLELMLYCAINNLCTTI